MNRTKKVMAIAWLMFWALMVAVAIQDHLRSGGHAIWQPVLWESSSALTAMGLLLLQRRATRRFDPLLATPWRWFVRQLAWLPVYWIAFVPIAFGIRHAVYALVGQVYHHQGWGEVFLYESVKISIFFSIFVVIWFGILSYHELLEEKLRAEQSNALLRQAQLQRLTQQMQPHFLFNALNTVSSLMHTNVERADATLVKLADVLRATLDVSEQHEAPLATELRIVQGYARVMEERFAERVEIDWQIDDAALACQVPVMSVQPLLENVFKHTVERRRGLTRISVSARCADGMLVLAVQDDAGTLAPTLTPGIGIRNLRERLAVLYGAPAGLTLSPCTPAGVRAEMRLPCAC
ncbi:MAG: histidine kinase [Pseudomonadota bacterium]